MKRTLGRMAAVALLLPAAAFAAGDNADFAKKAAHGNLKEVALGELAVEQAGSEAVKSFGQRMIDDHSKAQDNLEQAADQEGIELPDGLDDKGRQKKQELSQKSGAAFDRAYMQAMTEDHEKDVEAYEKAEADTDGALNDYVQQTLPVLRQHHELAQQTLQQIK